MAGRSESTASNGAPRRADERSGPALPRPQGSMAGAVRYEFLVAGKLSEAVLESFPELRSSAGPAGGTALYGLVEDTAHLHGLLSRFQTLGISIAEMRQLPD